MTQMGRASSLWAQRGSGILVPEAHDDTVVRTELAKDEVAQFQSFNTFWLGEMYNHQGIVEFGCLIVPDLRAIKRGLTISDIEKLKYSCDILLENIRQKKQVV